MTLAPHSLRGNTAPDPMTDTSQLDEMYAALRSDLQRDEFRAMIAGYVASPAPDHLLDVTVGREVASAWLALRTH